MKPGAIIKQLIWAIVLPLLISATEPPALEGPRQYERSFTITSTSLVIIPSKGISYLRFENGVEVNAKDFQLIAETVEIDIDSSGLASQEIGLPNVEAPPERVVEDPGSVAAEMARGLKMPQARFDPSVLRRIAAAGGVSVRARGVSFDTDQLVSTDGGETWTASGGSSLAYRDADSGADYKLNANSIAYNRISERALAEGQLRAEYASREGPPIVLTADRGETNLRENSVSVSGNIVAQYGEMTLICTTLTADLDRQLLHANGGAMLSDKESGITLTATALDVYLAEKRASASGGVHVEHEGYRAELVADRIEADIANNVIMAEGAPVIKFGNSSFSGKQIKVSLAGERTIIEVDGEQSAAIDIDDIRQLNNPRSDPGPVEPGEALPVTP
jgi:lipopolysaccharide export system protein LptA